MREGLYTLIAVLRAAADAAQREADVATGDIDFVDAHAEARALRKAAAMIEGYVKEAECSTK